MNRIRSTTALFLLACSGFAWGAAMTIVEEAYEVRLEWFRAPATTAGTLSFRECEDCDLLNLSVSAKTRYWVDGEEVALSGFRSLLARVTDRENALLIVSHHKQDDVVTRVKLSR